MRDLKGSCLYQMALPTGMANKSYGSLFYRLARKGIVPLGLLRCTGMHASVSPYVYTNPSFDTELTVHDRVFVLSVKPVEDGGQSLVCHM